MAQRATFLYTVYRRVALLLKRKCRKSVEVWRNG